MSTLALRCWFGHSRMRIAVACGQPRRGRSIAEPQVDLDVGGEKERVVAGVAGLDEFAKSPTQNAFYFALVEDFELCRSECAAPV